MKQKAKGWPRVLRVVAGCSLLGTVAAGTLFGWIPALAMFPVHEIGAVLGAAVGVAAQSRHVA